MERSDPMRAANARTGGLLERVGAASGATYVVLLIVGGSMMTSGATDSVRPTGEQSLANLHRTAESGSAKVEFGPVLVGFAAFIVFLGYLYEVLRRAEEQRSWL